MIGLEFDKSLLERGINDDNDNYDISIYINPLSSSWRMQQDAPKLDDHSLQLEILVAIQCNDDDEDQTSHVNLQNCIFMDISKIVNSTSHVLQLENLVAIEWECGWGEGESGWLYLTPQYTHLQHIGCACGGCCKLLYVVYFGKLQNNGKLLHCRSRWQVITSWLSYTEQCNARRVLHCYIFTTGSWDPQLVKRGRRQEARYLTTKAPSPPLLLCQMGLKHVIHTLYMMHIM